MGIAGLHAGSADRERPVEFVREREAEVFRHAASPCPLGLLLGRGAGVAGDSQFPVAVESVVAVAAVHREEACGLRCELRRQCGDERHGGKHGPGFERLERQQQAVAGRHAAHVGVLTPRAGMAGRGVPGSLPGGHEKLLAVDLRMRGGAGRGGRRWASAGRKRTSCEGVAVKQSEREKFCKRRRVPEAAIMASPGRRGRCQLDERCASRQWPRVVRRSSRSSCRASGSCREAFGGVTASIRGSCRAAS